MKISWRGQAPGIRSLIDNEVSKVTEEIINGVTIWA